MFDLKKLPSKPSNIFDVFKSFYYGSRCIGTAPFTITVENDNNVVLKTTIKDYIIFFIFNIIFAIVLYAWASGKLSSNLLVTSSEVVNYGNQLMVLCSINFSFFNNCINFVLKKRTIGIINDLISVDSSIKKINLDVDYKSQSRIVNKYLLMVITLIVVLSAPSGIVFYLVSDNILKDFSLYTTLLINNIYYINFVSQFILCLLSVYERFRQLNQGIEEIFKFNKNYEKHDFSDVVKKIATIHDSLIEVVQKINFRFSIWIMISLAAIFVFFTLSAFTFVRSIIIFEKSKFLFSFSTFIWCVYYLSFLVMAIAVGSWTTIMVFFFKIAQLIKIKNFYVYREMKPWLQYIVPLTLLKTETQKMR